MLVTDRDLIERVISRGDESAFEQLYERHAPAAYKFAVRLVGGHSGDAEDVLQNTWLRAMRGLTRFRGASVFRTWLMGITLNCARELLRERPVWCESATRETVASPCGRAPDTLALERAIAQLPDPFRIVFVLHEIEGYTHDEIAAQLGIAVGTSKSRAGRARNALRHMLQPGKDSPDG